MGKYGEAAVHATGFLASQIDCPNEAWRKAVSEVFPESVSSQKKSCPKSAYLGLCEAGVIAGVPKGDYTRSTDNKRYALEAMSILVSSPVLATDHKTLWSKTRAPAGACRGVGGARRGRRVRHGLLHGPSALQFAGRTGADSGLRILLLPAVSADRKSTRLNS